MILLFSLGCDPNHRADTHDRAGVSFSRYWWNQRPHHRHSLWISHAINDYLLETDLQDVSYFYRVKTGESILDKIKRYSTGVDTYPVQNWMNDIFGCRTVLPDGMIEEIISLTDGWQEAYGLKNWYFREKQGYRGIHIYFKNRSNFYFPRELQVWEEKDVKGNIESHRKHKRNFVE